MSILTTFLGLFLQIAWVSVPFFVWMAVMLIVLRNTAKELVQRRKTLKVLAIVAGSIGGTIVVVLLAFSLLITVAVAHM